MALKLINVDSINLNRWNSSLTCHQQNCTIHFIRALLLELKQMKDLHHDHLTRWVGACLEEGETIRRTVCTIFLALPFSVPKWKMTRSQAETFFSVLRMGRVGWIRHSEDITIAKPTKMKTWWIYQFCNWIVSSRDESVSFLQASPLW